MTSDKEESRTFNVTVVFELEVHQEQDALKQLTLDEIEAAILETLDNVELNIDVTLEDDAAFMLEGTMNPDRMTIVEFTNE